MDAAARYITNIQADTSVRCCGRRRGRALDCGRYVSSAIKIPIYIPPGVQIPIVYILLAAIKNTQIRFNGVCTCARALIFQALRVRIDLQSDVEGTNPCCWWCVLVLVVGGIVAPRTKGAAPSFGKASAAQMQSQALLAQTMGGVDGPESPGDSSAMLLPFDTGGAFGGWASTPPMHCKRFAPGGCVADEKFVVCGGSDGSKHHNSCEVYLPAPKKTLPKKQADEKQKPAAPPKPAAGGLFGPLSFGPGVAVAAPPTDAAGGEWKLLPPMPTARAGCTACFVGGAVVVIGGEDGSGAPMATVEALDMNQGKWIALPSLSTPRTGAGCCAIGNVIYVVGGSSGRQCAATCSIEILDLSKAWDKFPTLPASDGRRPDTWHPGPPMKTARAWAAVCAHEGVVYAVGGVDAERNVLDTMEILDTSVINDDGLHLPVVAPRTDGAEATTARASTLQSALVAATVNEDLAKEAGYTPLLTCDSNGDNAVMKWRSPNGPIMLVSAPADKGCVGWDVIITSNSSCAVGVIPAREVNNKGYFVDGQPKVGLKGPIAGTCNMPLESILGQRVSVVVDASKRQATFIIHSSPSTLNGELAKTIVQELTFDGEVCLACLTYGGGVVQVFETDWNTPGIASSALRKHGSPQTGGKQEAGQPAAPEGFAWLGWEAGFPSTMRYSSNLAEVGGEPAHVDEVSQGFESFCTSGGSDYRLPCTVYAKLFDDPETCSLEKYKDFAAERGKRIPNCEHPGGGNGYSSSYVTNNQYGYEVMSRFWKETVMPAFPDVTWSDVLVMHGNKSGGFCFNAEPGAMHAFGEPSTENGYGYCRSPENAAKLLHIYLCV